MKNFEYAPVKNASTDARAIRSLVLQDVIAGKFPNPKKIADPNNMFDVFRQRKKLLRSPENYTAVYDDDDELVAFMKTAGWSNQDQIYYSNPEEIEALEALMKEGYILSPQNKLGIFGLVVASRLHEDEQGEIVERLLDTATDRGLDLRSTAINIPFHSNDIVRAVAKENGFVFTGRIGEDLNVPGVLQRLYTKPLDT